MTLISQAWQHRALILAFAIAGLVALAKRQQEQIGGLKARLEMKPAVVERETVKTVQGPVRVVEKIVEKPGGERVIEREIIREVKVTEKGSEHIEAPVCPAQKPAKRWLVGASADPARAQDGQMIHAGITVANSLDLTFGRSLKLDRNDVRIALRF